LKQSPQELQSQPQHEERCSPSQKSPVEEQSFFCEQEKEIELLQEELHNQQKLSGGLRVQLLDQEDQVAELTEAIKTAQVERRNLETEQQESEQEAQGLRQELATSRRQIVEEQTINRALRQQLEVSQKSPQLDNSTLAADLAEARRLAQVHIQNGETLGALLKSESTARHNLEVRLHFLEQRQGQTNPFLRQQANEIVQLRNTVAGYEDQLKNAVALKDRAEGQVEQLKEEVQALVNGVTLQYVNDGVKDEDLETSMVVKPNELHDLRQSFELSQAKCSEVLKANDKLFEQAEDAKKAALALRADNDLQKDKVARYSAAFKTVQEKVNNWTQTLPGIAQMQDSIDEVPGLQELLETSAVHEQDTVKMVKKQVDEISQLKAKVLRRERKFCREVEHLTQRMDKLQEENIRLDESNCNLTAQIEDLQQEKAVIQHDLDQMTRACEIWEQQCNEQAFGDTAELLTAAHKQEAEHASDQVAALTNRIALMNRAYHMMEWDLNSYQGWAAREMEGIRTLGAERDWYRAQTNALRRRFQSELLARPLDIPWRSDFSDMTSEKQRDLIAGEDAIIQTLVGMNLGRVADIERENARRGENGGPSGIETDQVWAPLIAEYLRVTRPKAEPAQGPPPKAGPTSAEKGKQRAEEGDGTSTFFSEGRRGLGIWMLGQVH
jgi:chromosome segregation ATPase